MQRKKEDRKQTDVMFSFEGQQKIGLSTSGRYSGRGLSSTKRGERPTVKPKCLLVVGLAQKEGHTQQ